MGMLGMGCHGEWAYNWMNELHWSDSPWNQCADDPTKSMDMAFYLSFVTTTGGEQILWCQPIEPGPPVLPPPSPPRQFPEAGIDEFPVTVAQVDVELINPPLGFVSLNLTGPMVVGRATRSTPVRTTSSRSRCSS